MKNYFENATIICLDGLDCSGKETISKLIEKSSKIHDKYDFVKTLSFPNYFNIVDTMNNMKIEKVILSSDSIPDSVRDLKAGRQFTQQPDGGIPCV